MSVNEPAFSRVSIIGLGLIGGSIASALHQQGSYVLAFDADPASVETGLKLGIVDEGVTSLESAITDVQLIVVAVPLMSMKEVFSSIRDSFESDVIVMDVGSVKGPVLQALENVHGSVPSNFVPGHPIAGSEKHGVAAADSALFKAHKVILTPCDETADEALASIAGLWESFGADVTRMQAEHHDLILAQTSHLPHLLAYALIDTLSSQGNSLEIFDFAAGGLRDFSRIASSDPQMWRDIFQSNRKPLLEILDRYMTELDELRGLIVSEATDKVFERLARAKTARDHFSRILDNRKK